MRSRWRRLGAGAAACVCLLLSAFAASASALTLTEEDTPTTIDERVNWFSGSQGAFSVDDAGEWLAYWDDDGVLTIARKGHEDFILRRRLTGETIPNGGDRGYTIGFAISDDRYHLSYRAANGSHRYLVGDASCLPELCALNAQADPTAEATMTDPRYFKDADGDLYFTWRNGTASNGQQMLNVYNGDTSWTHLGAILSGTDGTSHRFDPDGAGSAPTFTSRARWPIVDELVFGPNDRLHMTWSWRENVAIDGNQHGLYYAWSDDYGRTWYASNGTRVGTVRSDPITFADTATQVLSEPPGYFIGAANLAIDSHGNPHMVKPSSDVQTADRAISNSRHAHFWRTTDGTWYARFIQASADGSARPNAGELFFNADDTAYFLFGRNDLGWEPWNANPLAEAELAMRNVTWDPGGALHVRVQSSVTALDTVDDVGIPISVGRDSVLRIRMRNDTAARDLRVFWTTEQDPTWTASKSQTFRGVLTPNDPGFGDYVVEITDADWTGTLRQLEIYPADGSRSGSVTIDHIRIRRRGTTTDLASWSFNSGNHLMAAEAAPADNWGRWEIGQLVAVPNAVGDAMWGMDPWVFDYTSRWIHFPFLAGDYLDGPWPELQMRHYQVPTSVPDKDWTFDADVMGWSASQDVANVRWQNDNGVKGIAGTDNGTAPRIQSAGGLDYDDAQRYVHVRLARQRAGFLSDEMRLEFTREDSHRIWEPGPTISLPNSPADYTTYTFDMSPFSREWSDTKIHRVRLTLPDMATGQTWAVDRIWVDHLP